MSFDKSPLVLCLATLLSFLGQLPEPTFADSQADDYIVIFADAATQAEIATFIGVSSPKAPKCATNSGLSPPSDSLFRVAPNSTKLDCGGMPVSKTCVASSRLYLMWFRTIRFTASPGIIMARVRIPNTDIDSERAWNVRTSADNVKVAIVDWGFEVDHPDLSANIDRFYGP